MTICSCWLPYNKNNLHFLWNCGLAIISWTVCEKSTTDGEIVGCDLLVIADTETSERAMPLLSYPGDA